jgi:YidC/Oxa1 family membrane protein insertase
MERNHLIGIILIFATLITFNVLTAPSKEELAKRQRERDSIELVKKDITKVADNAVLPNTNTALTDTSKIQTIVQKDSTIVLENEDIKVHFSTKGGKISKVILKKYNKKRGEGKLEQTSPVELLEDTKNVFNLQVPLKGVTYASSSQIFTPVLKGKTIEFTWNLDGTSKLVQSYTLPEKGYGIDYLLSTPGIPDQNVKMELVNHIDKIEKGFRSEQQLVSVYYKNQDDDDLEYCSCTSNDNEQVTDRKLNWVSNTNQFFNTSLISKSGGFLEGEFSTEMKDFEKDEDLKKLTTKIGLPIKGGSHNLQWYVGPNDFNTLRAYNNGMENIIPYGSSIFGAGNRWIIRPFFEFINKFVTSKGFAIILLIFLIKMLLYPLLYKMLHSQAKMAALKPELDKMKLKFKDDTQKQQVESMKVYQEYGVSPFAGCLPMLMQMPIWIALYRFFPSNITFRQESFLWASDLSSYDAFFNLGFEIPFMGTHISLFTLLWAISTLIYTYYSTKDVDMSANPAMKYVQYFMPLMFLGFFNSYASGLTCYMFFSNLINIAQTLITKHLVFDQTKIRAELEKSKGNPKKKSGFMAKMEEAVKMQQKMAEEKAKNSKK